MDVFQHLGFQEANDNIFFLGFPNKIDKNKRVIFGFLKEKLQERIQGWDRKMLSKGGKEILLKTFAQALPDYAMSCSYCIWTCIMKSRG